MNPRRDDATPSAWLTEPLSGGDARWWTHIGRPYTKTQAQRDHITAAITELDWYTWPGVLPWWSGTAVAAIIKRLGLRYVGQVGTSRGGVEYVDPTSTAPGRTVEINVYELMAIRQLTHHGWFTSYWLDTEPLAVCVATATECVHRKAPISLACALTRHDRCTGITTTPTSEKREAQKPCACGCGCILRNRKDHHSEQ